MANICKKSGAKGYVYNFVVNDWTLDPGFYKLNIQHNLENLDLNTEIWENEFSKVETRIEIINTNTIRLVVPADPDCRFAGKAIITSL